MTDTTQTELLPCPFCGGKPYITIEHCTDGSTFVFAFVKCSCGAKSPEKGFTQGNDCPQLYAEVRELWNTRQPTGVAAEAVLQISDELVDKAVWALLDYGQLQTDEIEEHPYRDWKVERSWTLNIARQQMRTALQAVLADDLTALEKDRKATEAAALKEAASLVPSGSDEWFDNLRPVHWKRMMAVLRKEILALIPPDDLTALEARTDLANAAVGAAVRACAEAILHDHTKPDDNRLWGDERPYICEESAYRTILALEPDAPSIISERERAAKVNALSAAAVRLKKDIDDCCFGEFDDEGEKGLRRGMYASLHTVKALIAATEGEK